jgi:ribose 5-phosphate isomerase A
MDREAMKRAAASRAVEEIEDGMILGLGSGSTAALAIEALAARIAKGLRVAGIPTSDATAALARRYGVPLTSFAEHRRIDLTIDGADEVERGTLHLIKGLGGALLHEKLVAAASARMIAVVDDSKLVGRLGARGCLPVEIVAFGWQIVMDHLSQAGMAPRLRVGAGDDGPFVTDGGNYIADCAVADIADPAALERRLAGLIGVVESGLFVGLASTAIVGGPAGVTVLARSTA